jgi:hypothetical protein
MENVARRFGIALPSLMCAVALLSMGCYCADGFDQYASDLANATIDAGSPAIVPLTVSVPGPSTTAGVGIELHVEDCRAGNFMLGARLLRSDGTTPATLMTTVIATSAGASVSCPGAPARFALSSSELTCADGRCTADLRVELTSSTGVGPREVEVRLVQFNPSSCHHSETLRTDGRIDLWGN